VEERSVFAIDAEKRSVTRALRYALIIGVAIAGVVLGLLATASGNTRLFERHYNLLLWLNVAIAAGLLLLVIELGRRMVSRYRRGIFGTRLMARLAGSFALMTVIPGLLIYFIAVQFLGRAVDSWFSVPVESALTAGLNLSRAALDAQLNDVVFRARRMELELGDTPAIRLPEALARAREQAGVSEALIITQTGRVLASSANRLTQMLPDMPPTAALRQAALTRQFAGIEAAEPSAGERPGSERNLKLRVVRQLLSSDAQENRFLQVVQPVSSRVADNAEAIRVGERDYQELVVARQGLKKIFRVTLTLTLLLTLFSAVAAAFLLAGWLTGPLTMLAAGTRAVSEGDFRQVKDYRDRDELGVLTQSFNRMTRQLTEARQEVQTNQREMEQANARLQSVLANMMAGVLAFDAEWRLVLANPGADQIVGSSCQRLAGAMIDTIPVIGLLAQEVRRGFTQAAQDASGSWQKQFTLEAVGDAQPRTLLMQGARLPSTQEPGYFLVFDDVSPVVSAQRTAAWHEVARRLAHEIKNPLTPIQLAAERLEFKLADKLPAEDAEFVRRNSRIIVNQVGAMKRMVDEFRDYARMPTAQLEPLDLNGLAGELVQLYGSGLNAPVLEFRAVLAPNLPRILGDATQLRQLIHNLLKNASEAVENRQPGLVVVRTEPAHGAHGEVIGVRLTVTDNGAGFAPGVLNRVFEPYVTTKNKGTGLGLAIVKRIVDDHGARIDVGTNLEAPSGASVTVLFTQLG
jgi:nitrogen fixation/metabolism regulation signal transduction histidine kinase